LNLQYTLCLYKEYIYSFFGYSMIYMYIEEDFSNEPQLL